MRGGRISPSLLYHKVMKLFRIVAVVVVLLMGSQVETEARGQVIKGLWKAGKELVKGASKQSSKGARGASKGVSKSSQKSSNAQSRAKDAPILVDCSRCKGTGKMPYWNSQLQQLQHMDCSNCRGLGKVCK